jgi:hypothetical protein
MLSAKAKKGLGRKSARMVRQKHFTTWLRPSKHVFQRRNTCIKDKATTTIANITVGAISFRIILAGNHKAQRYQTSRKATSKEREGNR